MVAVADLVDRKRIGQAIQARRKELGIGSQEELAWRAGLSPSTIAKLESGRQDPFKMSFENLLGLLQALRWTAQELSQATGVPLPAHLVGQLVFQEVSTPLPETGELWHFEIYGSVAAGDRDAKPLDGEYVSVPAAFLRRKGVVDPRTVKVYKVNGDCMVSDEVRRMERNIAPGDYVFVDTSRRPKPGDVVVAWWPREEKMVLKRYKVEGENIVLYPANPAHPMIVLPSEEDVNVVGVVVARFG